MSRQRERGEAWTWYRRGRRRLRRRCSWGSAGQRRSCERWSARVLLSRLLVRIPKTLKNARRVSSCSLAVSIAKGRSAARSLERWWAAAAELGPGEEGELLLYKQTLELL